MNCFMGCREAKYKGSLYGSQTIPHTWLKIIWFSQPVEGLAINW